MKLGLRTATLRVKDSNEMRPEPTLQQINEEGEGELVSIFIVIFFLYLYLV